MKHFLFFIFYLGIIVLNFNIDKLFFSFPVRVNLLALPMIFLSLEDKNYKHLVHAFCLGLFLDLFSSFEFGSYILSFVLTAGVLNIIARFFWANEMDVKIVFIFAGIGLFLSSFLKIFFTKLLFLIFYQEVGFEIYWTKIIYSLLVSLLFAPIILFIWRKFNMFTIKLTTKRLFVIR